MEASILRYVKACSPRLNSLWLSSCNTSCTSPSRPLTDLLRSHARHEDLEDKMNLRLRSRSSEYSRCDNILAVVSGFSVPILNEGLLLFLYLTNGRTSASLFLFSDIIRLGSQFQAIPSDQRVGSRVRDVGCDRFRTNKLACLASKTLTMDLGIEPRIFS